MGTRAIITHPTNPSGTALRIEPHFESAFCTPNRSVPNAAVVNVLGTSGDFTRISYQSTDHELIGWVRSALLSMLPNFGGTSATEILAPTTVGDCFLEFKLGPETGLRVPPQEQAPLLGLPPQYHHLTVRTIVLLHRKDLHNEEDMVSWPDHGGIPDKAKGRDTKPCYTKLEARLVTPPVPTPKKAKVASDGWHVYVDEYGAASGEIGTQPGKFAEARPKHDPEVETLHDWPEQSCGPACFDQIRLTSVGLTAVHIHSVRCYFFPAGRVVATVEEIFSPSTSFGDYPPAMMAGAGLPLSMRQARFGGGEWAIEHGALLPESLNARGMYPGAIQLGVWPELVHANPQPRLATLDNAALLLDMPPGVKRLYLEFACGDTNFDVATPAEEQRQEDGYYGKRGWAKLCMTGIRSKRAFLDRENVPPAGVLACVVDAASLPADEKLRVESRNGHATWLMGYRMLVLEPEEE